MSLAPGTGEDYEIAVLVLKHLSATEAGREWLVKAHAAAKSLVEELVRDTGTGAQAEPRSEEETPEEDDLWAPWY